MDNNLERLRSIKTFPSLVKYLRDELDWPVETDDFDELTFEYDAEELGLDEKSAARVKKIWQLRPLTTSQPWGIFFVEFENKKLPVVVLRSILSHLVITKRESAKKKDAKRWQPDDLLFISAFGDEATDQREIAFAHFHQEDGDLPTLRVLGWDGGDTPLKLEHVAATLTDKLGWPSDEEDTSTWRKEWSRAFRHRIGHVIRTSDMLADVLASLARRIRDAAKTKLAVESSKGRLQKLYKGFQSALIHDLEPADFADTYAQTITYGLLTAAISRTDITGELGTWVLADNIADMVPITNPFLQEILNEFLEAGGRRGGIDFDELGVQDVVELLRGDETDLPAILRDFGNRTQGEDPVIHFYEHFLAAYNKKQKIQRGVFYTPQPVVSYIVRSVHGLLQSELGLEDGLASTVTWKQFVELTKIRTPQSEVKIPDGVRPDTPFVQILDPATGTATFLVEVIEVVYRHLKESWEEGGLKRMPPLPTTSFPKRATSFSEYWNQYVALSLLRRLHGYELMMAPYAIAHMKIGLKLFETGYRFGSEERARVFLTNALEPPQEFSDRLAFDVPALAHEANAVNAIKRFQRFTVVLGNPPYAGESMNTGNWIRDLIETYMYVEGVHLREKGKKNWLQDDYVKFIRFAQFEIDRTNVGILGFINNHGLLNNPTFRGMRASLLNSFGSIYVLDLHGNMKKRERSPDGLPDQNVFDIQQGVAIGFYVRSQRSNHKSKVRHAGLWGPRGNPSTVPPSGKYGWLLQHKASSTDWAELIPSPLFYLFVPENSELKAEYDRFWKLTEAMPHSGSGITTSRDHFVIDFADGPLRQRLELFRDPQISDDYVRREFGVGDNSMWSMSEARKQFRKQPLDEDLFVDVLYRPFDVRRIYFETNVVFNMRIQVMRHLLKANRSLITVRRVEIDRGFDHVFCSSCLSVLHSVSIKESNVVFPLFLYPEDYDQQQGMPEIEERRPNFGNGFLRALSLKLGLRQNAGQAYRLE